MRSRKGNAVDEELTVESLYALGFREAAKWRPHGELLGYVFTQEQAELSAIFDVADALYAFCEGDRVLYIGKTARSLRRRMAGYCRPGSSQATNRRCHDHIRSKLAAGREISILAFAPPGLLQYGGFEINLAAGLEDALIRQFSPPWNGGRSGAPLTETAEVEAAQEDASVEPSQSGAIPLGMFAVHLGKTYYEKGIVNPGSQVSGKLGRHDEAMTVRFSDGAATVASRIDRNANLNGSVRFVGSNQAIADWFQRHFRQGDTVTVRILGPNEVEFQTPAEAQRGHD